MTLIPSNLPQSIINLVQERTLERLFHDALIPRQLFRLEATPELWQANLGEEMFFTRPGIIQPNMTPLRPGQDPTPRGYQTEQWRALAKQFSDTIDTHMPTSYVTLAPLFARNTQQLGINAGMTLDRISRNTLFTAYLGGEAMTTVLGVIGSTQLRVDTLNGFGETVANGRLTAVSPSAPIAVSFSTAEPANSVVGVVPDDPELPNGPGMLILSAGLTTAVALRTAVRADNRSRRLRVGGHATVDSLNAADILTLNDIISAVSRLREQNVPPHADGYYHVHLGPMAEAEIFRDNHWQRLHQSLPESYPYKELAMGQAVGCIFFRNNEVPALDNCGNISAVPGTTGGARVSADIGAELTNDAGLPIRRTIITGGGALYEKYLDESKYISEAGVTGKVGSFSIVNNGIQVMTDRIRYIIRAPLDRVQQVVSQTWSWSGDFPVPSDSLSGDGARFKRAVIVEHA